MQVILREDVHKLGRCGETVRVRDGYGRNYLIPRGLAVLASPRNIAQADHDKRVIEHRNKKLSTEAEQLKARIEELSINIAKQVGEEGKLFGSVTTREIAEALALQGFDIDRRSISLAQPIKSLGVHSASVKLPGSVTAELKIWVVQQ